MESEERVCRGVLLAGALDSKGSSRSKVRLKKGTVMLILWMSSVCSSSVLLPERSERYRNRIEVTIYKILLYYINIVIFYKKKKII